MLPRLGQGMESGTIVRWLKSEGEPVEKGEPLFELDTDKVTQEVEAEAAGVLLKIAVAEGEVPVGKTVALHRRRGRGRPRGRGELRRPQRGSEAQRAGARAGESRRTQEAAVASGERPDQGVAARAAHRARARHRARRDPRHRPRRPHRRRGRRARRGRRPGCAAGCTSAGPGRRGRARPALERPQDDRAPADRGVADPGLPAPGVGRHDARERARREAPRARPGRPHHGHRRPHEGLRAGADASPRGERGVHRGRDPRSIRARTSASPSPRRRGSSCPSSAAPSGSRSTEIAGVRADLVGRARDGKLRADDLDGGTFTISNLGMYAVEQLHRRAQPAAGRDRRRRRDARSASSRSTASSSCGR